MKMGKLHKKLVGFGLAVFFFAGFGFLIAPEASAQYRRNDRGAWRTERVESRNISRIAEAQGRSDGCARRSKRDSRQKTLQSLQ